MGPTEVRALQALRSDPGARYCVSCWAEAAHVGPRELERLRMLAFSFIDAEDPTATENGRCSHCRASGLVVSVKERRQRAKPRHRNV